MESAKKISYTGIEGSATHELQWMWFLLHDFHHAPSRLSVLYCDNQSVLHISANPEFHELTKHLDIDCHLVREKLQAGVMRLLPVSSQNQTADVFTKAAGPCQFHECITKQGMADIYQPPVCEGVLEQCTNEKKEVCNISQR